jgi:hypothetical protein
MRFEEFRKAIPLTILLMSPPNCCSANRAPIGTPLFLQFYKNDKLCKDDE